MLDEIVVMNPKPNKIICILQIDFRERVVMQLQKLTGLKNQIVLESVLEPVEDPYSSSEVFTGYEFTQHGLIMIKEREMHRWNNRPCQIRLLDVESTLWI